MKTYTGLLRLLAILIVSSVFCLGCFQHRPRLVPVSQSRPVMTYQNSSPRFNLKVFMYAPGNLLFRVENLLPQFHLQGLPEITSSTGRIVEARVVAQETIEFNLILPAKAYALSSNDVTISWILEETGPGAFLRSEGEILVDIASSPETEYLVKSVRYRPATDQPRPASRAP